MTKEPESVGKCEYCKENIWVWEEYYNIEDIEIKLHEEGCLSDFARENWKVNN